MPSTAPRSRAAARLARRLAPLLAALAGGACEPGGPRLGLAFGPPPIPDDRPIEAPSSGYVGSGACQACHPGEYDSWHGSYHRRMTQEPSPETVLADFDDVALRSGEREARLFRRGEEYWVELDAPEAEADVEGVRFAENAAPRPRVERQIVLVTGSHQLQCFWVSSAPGETNRKLSFFPFAWRVDERRWIPLDAAFLVPPSDSQLTELGRWNKSCSKCHTTHVRPRIESADRMDTLVSEFGISCEACHGPGAEHVEANRDPVRRYELHLSGGRDDTIVQPEHLEPRLASQVCGQCHCATANKDLDAQFRFMDEGYPYRPGGEITADRVILSSGDEHFWPDGMIRVSGREYNGLIRSPCYVHGDESRGILTCLSCHQLHHASDDPRPLAEWADDQMKPDHLGNAACTSCHPEYADDAALAAHSRHAAGTTGSLCYDCHMPYTTWGLMKALRSHEVSSPDVRASVAVGRPNACNLCHLDRTLAWAADELEAGWGVPRPELDEDQRTIAASVLWLLTGDAGQRALMAWHLGWEPARETAGTDWLPPYLAQLLLDPYDAVRYRAHRSLRTLPGYEDVPYDFVGPMEMREAARVEVHERWKAAGQGASRAEEGPLLMNVAGGIVRREFNRLFAARNDRPVYLSE